MLHRLHRMLVLYICCVVLCWANVVKRLVLIVTKWRRDERKKTFKIKALVRQEVRNSCMLIITFYLFHTHIHSVLTLSVSKCKPVSARRFFFCCYFHFERWCVISMLHIVSSVWQFSTDFSKHSAMQLNCLLFGLEKFSRWNPFSFYKLKGFTKIKKYTHAPTARPPARTHHSKGKEQIYRLWIWAKLLNFPTG